MLLDRCSTARVDWRLHETSPLVIAQCWARATSKLEDPAPRRWATPDSLGPLFGYRHCSHRAHRW